MSKLLYLSITWPFYVIEAVVSFIIWEILSGGRWKQRAVVKADPAIYWQNRALAATRELREIEDELKRREKEQERKK